ncbi:MAG: YchJ family protein [Coleofasciculaceae cyanobacterium RL_1_1]|nr:YchJ family protein [Coleofasciculaceae cyanobacterium RL_1_1]
MLISDTFPPSTPCPCGTGQPFADCCAPYLQGQHLAPTAEALMRSRYSAYCLKNIDYLIQTHHPTRRKSNSRRQITATVNGVTWLGLTVVATQAGQPEDQTGVVEFVAVYQEGLQAAQLHERSRFLSGNRVGGFIWMGEMLPPLKPNRNQPCWCHSGKTFKQCHGKKR